MTEVLSDNLVLVQDEEDREKVDFDSFLNQDEDEGQQEKQGLDIEEAALDLFNKMFLDQFEKVAVSHEQFDAKTGQFYITRDQYEQSVVKFGAVQGANEDDENITHLLQLFARSQQKITKRDIIKVFRKDLKNFLPSKSSRSSSFESNGQPEVNLESKLKSKSQIEKLSRQNGQNLPKSGREVPRKKGQKSAKVTPQRAYSEAVISPGLKIVKSETLTSQLKNEEKDEDPIEKMLRQSDQAYNEAAERSENQSDKSVEAMQNFVDFNLIEKRSKNEDGFFSPARGKSSDGSGLKYKNFGSMLKKDLEIAIPASKSSLRVTSFELSRVSNMSYSELKKSSIQNIAQLKVNKVISPRANISDAQGQVKGNEPEVVVDTQKRGSDESNSVHDESPANVVNTNNSLIYGSKDEDEEKVILHQQSQNIFSMMFADKLEQASFTDQPIIYKAKYMEAVEESPTTGTFEEGTKEKQVLMSLFKMADTQGKGYLTKSELISAIERDLMYGQEASTELAQIELNRCSSKDSMDEIFGGQSPIKADQQVPYLPDSVIQMMKDQFSEEMDPKKKCQNLYQSVEYVERNRIGTLMSREEHAREMLQLVMTYLGSLQTDIDSLVMDRQEKNEVLEANQEMEAHIESLVGDIETLRTYESCYHELKSNLDLAMEKNQDLEIEKDNLNQMNKDLLTDLNQTKQTLDQVQMKSRCDQLLIQEQKIQINQLKEALLKKQQQDFKEFQLGNEEEDELEQLLNISEEERAEPQIQVIEGISDDDESDGRSNEMEESKSPFTIHLPLATESEGGGIIQLTEEEQHISLSAAGKKEKEQIENLITPMKLPSTQSLFNHRKASFQDHHQSNSKMSISQLKLASSKSYVEQLRQSHVKARSFVDKTDRSVKSSTQRQLVFSNPMERVNQRIILNRNDSDSQKGTTVKASMNSSEANKSHPMITEQDVSMIEHVNLVEETNLLAEIEALTVPILKQRLKSYILDQVQGERYNLMKQLSHLRGRESKLKEIAMKLRLQLKESVSELKTTRNINDEFEMAFEQKSLEIERLKAQLIDLAEENSRIKEEKQRLYGVNQLLQNRIQIEKSEKQSFLSDFNFSLLGKNSSILGRNQLIGMTKASQGQFQSKVSTKMRRQEGTYHRTEEEDLSVTDPQPKFKRGHTHMSKGLVQSQIESQNESRSIKSRHRQFMKNQFRNFGDELSDFNGDNSSIIRLSQMSRSNVGYSRKQSRLSIESPTKVNGLQRTSTGFSKGLQSTANHNSRLDSQGGRVQMISDFESEEFEDDLTSIQGIQPGEIAEMNQHIQDELLQQMKEKRLKNSYDQLGLTQPKLEEATKRIDKFLSSETELKGSFSEVKDQRDVFSSMVKVYFNKILQDGLLLIHGEEAFVVSMKGSLSMESQQALLSNPKSQMCLLCRPFNILDDVKKLKYSQDPKHKTYLALNFVNMRKLGNRDHLILDLPQPTLLNDYFMEQAEKGDDDIIFEENSAFSMLVNNSPVWFSFDDLNACKLAQARLLKSDQTSLTGYLEIKQSGNIFKQLFKGQVWEMMYFVLKGSKVFVYKTKKDGGQSTKPSKVLSLNGNMEVKEIRKADVGGKEFVFEIRVPKDNSSEIDSLLVSAQMQSKYERWTKAMKVVRNQLRQAEQKQMSDDEEQAADEFNFSQLQALDGIAKSQIKGKIASNDEKNKLVFRRISVQNTSGKHKQKNLIENADHDNLPLMTEQNANDKIELQPLQRVSTFDTSKSAKRVPESAFLLSSVVKNLQLSQDKNDHNQDLRNPSAETVKYDPSTSTPLRNKQVRNTQVQMKHTPDDGDLENYSDC